MSTLPAEDSLRARLDALEARIVRACERASRPRESVELMLVSKTVPRERVLECIALGPTHFGENKVQEGLAKFVDMPPGVRVDMIGHLQTNKVRNALRFASAIHGVDRESLVEAIERAWDGKEPVPVYVQVNTSAEPSKFGVAPEALEPLVRRVLASKAMRFRGLMTIGKLAASPEEARPYFRLLRGLRDRLVADGLVREAGLSMGMTGDFEVAIEEGATVIRVGTAVFGTRPTSDAYYWPEGPST